MTVDAVEDLGIVDAVVEREDARRYRPVGEDRRCQFDRIEHDLVARGQRKQFLALQVTHEVMTQRRQSCSGRIDAMDGGQPPAFGLDAQHVVAQARRQRLNGQTQARFDIDSRHARHPSGPSLWPPRRCRCR